MIGRNDKQLSLLIRELEAIGFKVIEQGLLQNETLTLKILDQRYDGIELYIEYAFGSTRIDFLLEYYLSEKLELSRKLYRKEISHVEFYTQFLQQYRTKLSTHEGVMKPYQKWKLNPGPNFEVLRQMIVKE